MFRTTTLAVRALLLSAPFVFFSLTACQFMVPTEKVEATHYDGPEQALQQELEMMRDPRTGQVPWHKLLEAKLATEVAKDAARQNRIQALAWEERGPNADVVGPSNGNSRANNGISAGRVRALMVDSLDPNKKNSFCWKCSRWTLENNGHYCFPCYMGSCQ